MNRWWDLPHSYRGGDWNAEDRHRAHRQGWIIKRDGSIHVLNPSSWQQRHSCSTPEELLQRCAADGSEFHQRAIAIVIKLKLTKDKSSWASPQLAS